MSRLFFIFFVFLHVKACEEVKYQKAEAATDATPPFPRTRPQYMRIVIVNSTITCSNLTSVDAIDYHFQETYYDQFLKITNSSIVAIPPMAFSKSPFLKRLFLSGNFIENIAPGAFTGLRSLEELRLDHNAMSIVPHLVFNSLYELRVLDLSHNRIKRFEKFALMGLNKLEVLDLRHNLLVVIEDGVLKSLKSVRGLFFSHNPLERISVVGLKHLETLALRNTSLSQYEDLANLTIKMLDLSVSHKSVLNFSCFPESQQLLLSKSGIESVVGVVSTGLQVLDLSTNSLQHLEGFLNTSQTIKRVDLSNNTISTIHELFFANLTRLAQLFLQHNNISKIETTLFRDLTSLVVLNLSNNALESFQYGTFDSLSNLHVLDISNNKLHVLQQLHSLPNLQHLRFDNNLVSELDPEQFFAPLTTISLDNNPWSCQNLVSIEAELRKRSVVVLPGRSFDTENFHGVACKNLKEIEVEGEIEKLVKFLEKRLVQEEKVEKLTSVQEVEMDYTSRIFVYVVVVQIVVLVLLLFVVFLIFKYVKNRKVEEPKSRRFPDFELF